MFVTAEDFTTAPYNLPYATDDGSFDDFVEDVEDTDIRDFFGSYFYDQLTQNLADLPADWDSTASTVINNEYVFGVDIWKALTVQTGTEPVAGADWEIVEEDNRWLLIKNGALFTYNRRKYDWKGMNDMEKPLVYARRIAANNDTVVDTGVVETIKENADNISPARRIFKNMLIYKEKALILFLFLKAHGDLFDDLFSSDDWSTMLRYLEQEVTLPDSENDFDL